jgi:hypothetical protein
MAKEKLIVFYVFSAPAEARYTVRKRKREVAELTR